MRIFYTFFLLLFLISCSIAPVINHEQNSDPIIVPKDFFGIIHVGMDGNNEEFRLLDEMNVVWILHTFNWHLIEKEKGSFDFSRFDNFVNRALREEKKVFVTLAYSNHWVDNDTGKTKYIPEKYIPDFLNYIEAIILHYRDKVSAWQIWNEPNFNFFWRGTNNEFYNLSRQTAQKIREIAPEVYVIGGGFAGSPTSFILGMKKAGATEHLDAISFHPYSLNPRWSMRLYDNFIRTISRIDFKGDIIISEMGFPTGGWYPHRVSLKNLPSYVVKTIVGSASRGTKVFLWYQFSDNYIEGGYPNKINSEMYFGLTYSDFTRKDGAWAYQICARYMPGSRYVPNLPVRERIPSSIDSFCFMNGINGNVLFLWNNIHIKQKLKLSLSSSFYLHNISNGNNSEFSNELILDITNQPVVVTWQGSSVPKISRVNN